MTVLVIILRIVWSLLAVGIIVTVLLHAAKGDGIAAIGGSAQMFASQKTAESNLDRVTWAITAGFVALTVVLSAGWLDRSTATRVPAGGPTQSAPLAPTVPGAPPPQPPKK
ncbi:preprotein translocase subunit SecG [Gloeobacter kilaueensis]|uniref:Protein-export membrane protein SecG n=1 Tax=Gloeobacter kilaueensis (strain ATCC BAA-2537 / CCAP 1431/1 / ULC 316 / JS1) TaxID=1183438 RepID=U5QDN0_GLOK1|nr:preprotein translocase subunit SecG [Gloeobacter kilaueensis]AGY57011.1 preprotein translocase subunit SecG [Gloeobacter kilaueensis JS1]